MRCKLAILLVLWGAVGGCGSERSQPEAVIAPPLEEPYVPPAANLLINPEFNYLPNGTIDAWRLAQHTGPASYSVSVNEGVATLQRVDKEPWGIFSQSVRSKAAVPLQGKRLRFSAELKADFSDEYGSPFQPAGLTVLLTGISAGQSGRDIILDLTEPIGPEKSGLGWQRYFIDFDVPGVESANWLQLQLGFLMTHGGSLSFRRPYLVEYAADQ